jgi:hypothetical protein
MVLMVTIGVTSSIGAPLVVLLSAPIPFIVLTVLISIAFINSLFLPKSVPDEASEVVDEPLYIEVWSPTNISQKV